MFEPSARVRVARSVPRVSRALTFGLTLAILALPLGCWLASRPHSTGPTDDSVWINKAIATAIRRGDHEMVLPAGEVTIATPITIPAGTDDFTIRGSGSTATTIYTSRTLDHAIIVGDNIQLHNNWGIRNRNNSLIQPVKQGDKFVTLQGGQRARANHYYVLWDVHLEGANNEFKTVVMNHAEIVRTKAVNGDRVELDEPAGREYTETPQLADVEPRMCRRIKVEGIGFNGGNQLPNLTTKGLLMASLIDGIDVSDVKIQHFVTDALYFVNCRHITVTKATIAGAGFNGPGGGYGVALSRCRFAQVTDSTADSERHGFIAHAGTMDASFERCHCTTASFDAHGMDERRIRFTDCVGDGTLQVGNQAWPEGDRDVTVSNCTFTGGLNVCARSVNIQVSDSKLGPIAVWSDLAGVLQPNANQAPDGVNLVRCEVTGGSSLFHEEAAPQHTCMVGSVTFQDCTFRSTHREWGCIFAFKKLTGHIGFNHCKFIAGSQRKEAPIQISDPNPGFDLHIVNSQFQAETAPSAVIVQPGYAGHSRFAGNTFRVSSNQRPVFVQNLSGVPVEESQNSAGGL